MQRYQYYYTKKQYVYHNYIVMTRLKLPRLRLSLSVYVMHHLAGNSERLVGGQRATAGAVLPALCQHPARRALTLGPGKHNNTMALSCTHLLEAYLSPSS